MSALGRSRQRARLARSVALIGVFVAVAALSPIQASVAQPVSPGSVGFRPFVDVTLTEPVTSFDDPVVNPAAEVVMAFVVANPADPCQPSWGARHPFDLAQSELDLDGRIQRYRDRGGEVAVSFGGAINDELAVVCTDPEVLLEAYLQTVERYQPVALDFDIEGDGLFDAEANARRNRVIVQLQERTQLPVWYTLPVFPDGLPEAGVELIEDALAAGVEIDRFNIMTMNFGAGGTPTLELVTGATQATHEQLRDIHRSAGVQVSDEVLWSKLSTTVMIGQNDVRPDQFQVAEASELVSFAEDNGLGQLSMWSVARDLPCERPGPILSGYCSGVDQLPAAFGATLAQYEGGSAPPWLAARDVHAAKVGLDPVLSGLVRSASFAALQTAGPLVAPAGPQ